MKNIVVIGAGIAGISSAICAVKSNYNTYLLESSSSLGGRTNSFKDFSTNEICDNGQHLLIAAYSHFFEIFDFINPQKFEYFFQKQNGIDINYLNIDAKQYKLKANVPFNLAVLSKITTLFALIKTDYLDFSSKMDIVRFALKVELNTWDKNAKNVFELLQKEKQSSKTISFFWEPLVLATLNTSIDNANIGLFITILKEGFFAGNGKSELILPKMGLSEIFDNFENVMQNKNFQMKYNSSVKKINVNNNKIESVIIGNNEEIKADYFISALAPNRLYSLLKQSDCQDFAFMDNLNNLEYSPIVSIYLWFEETIDLPSINACVSNIIHWIFNRRVFTNSEEEISNKYKGHLTLTISAANHLIAKSNLEIIEIIKEELYKLLPKLKNNKILHSKIIKEKRATLASNNSNEAIRQNIKSPYSNLILAGDWTNTGLPGTIEGAAKSAFLAIDQIKLLDKFSK